LSIPTNWVVDAPIFAALETAVTDARAAVAATPQVPADIETAANNLDNRISEFVANRRSERVSVSTSWAQLGEGPGGQERRGTGQTRIREVIITVEGVSQITNELDGMWLTVHYTVPGGGSFAVVIPASAAVTLYFPNSATGIQTWLMDSIPTSIDPDAPESTMEAVRMSANRTPWN
jgi:hypothetical protein